MIPPPEIPGWRIESLLGRGGFADVWKARSGERRAAIKIGRTATAAAVERLDREAAALAAVGPPVAPALIERATSRSGAPALIMELLDGEALADQMVGATAPPSPATVARLGADLIAAVDRIHACGWVHADIKPSNLRVAGERLRVLDFGLAARPGSIGRAGTPNYASPEQIRGESIGPPTDLFSVGVVLYELVSLERPFGGDSPSYAHLALEPTPLDERVSAPRAAAEIISACLEKDPRRRPVDLVELAARWKAAFAGSPTLALREVERRRAPPERRALVAAVRVPRPRSPSSWLRALLAAGGFPIRLGPSDAVAGFVEGNRVHAALEWAGAQPWAVVELVSAELVDRPGRPPLTRLGSPVSDAIPPSGEIWLSPSAAAGAAATAVCQAAPDGYRRLQRDARPPPLVGRDRELEAGLAALEERAVLVVAGAAGVGKTRLASALAERTGAAQVSATDLSIEVPTTAEALIVDDLERADDAVLDALERAAVDGELALVAFARPALSSRRPGWGERCPRLRRETLGPLDRDAAADLAAALLADVELAPRELLERLAELARGNPAMLVELVAAARTRGLVIADPDSGRRRLAPDALEDLDDLPLGRWIAEAAIRDLPPDLAELLAALACGPEELEESEIPTLAAALGVGANPRAGLGALLERGLVRRRSGRSRLASELVRRGLATQIDRDARVRIGKAGLAHFAGRPLVPRVAAARAHYAELIGDVATVAAADLALAADARLAHRYHEAEYRFGRALARVESFAARLGRGAIRYRIDRAAEGLDDLERAEALAADDRARFRAIAEQATCLDWLGRYSESAARAERATSLAETASERAIATTARGRSELRANRPRSAARLLALGAESAAAGADRETRVVALLLLGPALVQLGHFDEAERRFAEVIDLCRSWNDQLHLAAAYGNRVILHSARGAIDAARGDLEAARAIARSFGHAVPERNTTYNLALYLYRLGDDAGARAHAHRARWLQRRFVGPALEDSILCARIELSLGNLDAARRELDAIEDRAPAERWTPAWRVIADTLRLALACERPATAEWEAISRMADEYLTGDDWIEVHYWGGRSGWPLGLERAREAATDKPLWRHRLAASESSG